MPLVSFKFCPVFSPLSVSLVPCWFSPLCSSPSLPHLASSLLSLFTCSSSGHQCLCVPCTSCLVLVCSCLLLFMRLLLSVPSSPWYVSLDLSFAFCLSIWTLYFWFALCLAILVVTLLLTLLSSFWSSSLFVFVHQLLFKWISLFKCVPLYPASRSISNCIWVLLLPI